MSFWTDDRTASDSSSWLFLLIVLVIGSAVVGLGAVLLWLITKLAGQA